MVAQLHRMRPVWPTWARYLFFMPVFGSIAGGGVAEWSIALVLKTRVLVRGP